jgi:hypothetical protein
MDEITAAGGVTRPPIRTLNWGVILACFSALLDRLGLQQHKIELPKATARRASDVAVPALPTGRRSGVTWWRSVPSISQLVSCDWFALARYVRISEASHRRI